METNHGMAESRPVAASLQLWAVDPCPQIVEGQLIAMMANNDWPEFLCVYQGLN